MGYEYDSKVNRDLARTAMSIYTKSHDIKPLNESAEFINEEALRENVNALILNYVSDVIVLAESHLGREMTDAEINESSMEVLNRIDSISPNEKAEFVQQLAEAAGPVMGQAAGMDSAPSDQGTAVAGRNGMGVAGKPQDGRPGVSGRRPTTGGPSVGAGPGAQAPSTVAGRPTTGGEFDPSNFSSIQDYLDSPDGFAANGGAGLAQVIDMIQNQGNQDGPAFGTG